MRSIDFKMITEKVGDYIALLGLMIKYKLFWIEKHDEIIELDSGEKYTNVECSIIFDPSF